MTHNVRTMNCEYSQIGFGGLGWSVGGGGAVVPVFTPGDPSRSSWNQIYDGMPRTFTGDDVPDYIFVSTEHALSGARLHNSTYFHLALKFRHLLSLPFMLTYK